MKISFPSRRCAPWVSARSRRSSLHFLPCGSSGISLVEALIAAVILAVVSTVAISVFNSVILFIGRTGQQASLNSIIDNDLARIRRLAQAYNACSSVTNGARGSVDTTGCGSYGETNSYFYFPDPARASGSGTDVATFEFACRSPTQGSHITEGFIGAIRATSEAELTGAGIQKSANRQPGAGPDNSNIVVTYAGPRDVSRTVIVSPYLAYWCP